jgi:hypothetical protein
MSDEVQIEVVADEENAQVVSVEEIIPEGDELTAVMTYLKQEYDTAVTEMQGRNDRLVVWRQNMEALANNAPKHSPFKNSSNVTVPVTQVLTQSVVAKIKGMIDARRPLWSVTSTSSDEEETKQMKAVQEYLDILAKSQTDLNMQEVLLDLFNETVLTGGCFPHVLYSVEKWRVKGQGDGTAEKEVVWHDGPQVVVRALEEVKYRRGVPKIQRLPWIAIDAKYTKYELMAKAANGEWNAEVVEEILSKPRTSPSDIEAQQQESETFGSGQTTDIYDISEVYFYWDIDKTGNAIDLVFTVHMDTGKVLKQQYNTLGTRNIVAAKYIHRPRALVGRGTGQLTESMQTEVTVTHNMRNDNAKTAGMRLLAVKRSAGFGAKRELFPGAVWEFDDPKNDVQAFQLGEVYPSSLQMELQGWSIAQKSVGLSDNQMGFADPTLGTRDTARGQSMRLQRGDTILENITEGLNNTLSEIGMLVWMQCVANKERVIARETASMRIPADKLELLKAALEVELTEVPMRMKFTIKTSEADQTFEQKKQTTLMLTQVYSAFAEKTAPLAQMVFGPQGQMMQQQMPEAWKYMSRILVGSGKLMTNVFNLFGIFDTQEYIPDPETLDDQLDGMQAAAPGMFQTPVAPPVGPVGAPGGPAGMNPRMMAQMGAGGPPMGPGGQMGGMGNAGM